MLILAGLLVGMEAFAQQAISGKIVDVNGEPVIGATVQVEGTNVGVVTDLNGAFLLNAKAGSPLLVSILGYQDTKASLQEGIVITIKEDSEYLDEVVVVGYGVQKRATLTGSVSQVSGDKVIKGKSTQNVAAALQGTIPGLTITRTSSRPGNEGTSITLRGGISVNSTEPMILIDGVEAYSWELSQINPNDIESVSVLKDASAAIYGTKAGGGVILITTKRGQVGDVKVTYSGSVHANVVGRRFPVADGQTWAQMLCDATTNDAYALLDANGNPQYSWWMWPEDVWRTLADGKVYTGVVGGYWRMLDPTSDQYDAVYGTTYGQGHNISLNGGSDKLRVMSSIGYNSDRSLLDFVYDGQKKYNFRTNVDYDINKYVNLSANVAFDHRVTGTPTQGIGHGIQDFYVFPLYNEYGQYYDSFGSNNLLAKLDEGGRTTSTEDILRLGGKLTVKLDPILKGLSFNASANIRQRWGKNIARQTNFKMYDWSGETKNSTGMPDPSLGTGTLFKENGLSNCWVKNTRSDVLYQVYNAFLNYDNEFGNHHVAVMAGVTAEKTHSEQNYSYRKNMPVDELDDINLGDATTAEATGGSSEVGMVSYLGRLNYDYKGIYLLEAQFRRDGSSRFSPENRWANFAGVSAGVRLAQMDFMKGGLFDELKIRASYGETGSQTGIGNYDYISAISTGTTIFGYTGTKEQTAWVNGMTSLNRSWERINTTNFGVDFALLDNRLSGSFEYYIRENKGMLISMTYPSTLGASAPKSNDGNFKANGWELELKWADRIGKDFSYNVGFSLADARTTVTSYAGAVAIKVGKNSVIEGKPINAIYVYQTDGYLQNAADVTAYYNEITKTAGGIHPAQNTGDQLTPGCVRRVDVNGDGRITTDDLVYYGDANPHYTFGITLGAQYKGFDFSMFIQGVGQQYVLREGQMMCPWYSGWTNQNATFYGNTWTVDNPNARYPIASRNGKRNDWNYKQYNDINVNNCWYARAKNLVIGYTLPENVIRRSALDNVRFYLAGDNIFEISNVKDGFDPESKPASGQGNVDVFARTLTFGIDLTF